MNRNRMLVGLGVALLVALLVSNFVYRKFQQASAVKSQPLRTIVVASKALPLGTRLDGSMLHTIEWPANQSATGMCTRMQDCINRALITPVAENEPIMQSKLAPIAAGAGLAAAIPPGMRAMSVAVNDVVGVAGFVTPGTMVDVLVTGAVASSQGGQNITRTILENVRVLAAGQKVQQQDQEGKPQTVSVITLLVSPEDAVKLAMGSTQGKIQLALRNTIDTDDTMPASVLQTSLFSSGQPVAPPTPLVAKHVAPKAAPPPAPAAYQVEIISGNKRETKSFTEQ